MAAGEPTVIGAHVLGSSPLHILEEQGAETTSEGGTDSKSQDSPLGDSLPLRISQRLLNFPKCP